MADMPPLPGADWFAVETPGGDFDVTFVTSSAQAYEYLDEDATEEDVREFFSVAKLHAYARTYADACVAEALERAAKVIPTNWLHPLLSGPESRRLPWGQGDVEYVLNAIRDEIRAMIGER